MGTLNLRLHLSERCSASTGLESMESMCPGGAKKLRPIPSGRKQAYRQVADPTFETYGPKTDAEYEVLIGERGGLPA